MTLMTTGHFGMQQSLPLMVAWLSLSNMVLDTDGKEIARLVPPANIGNLSVADFVDFLRKAKHEFASR